jgi:hypothetical protein
VTKREEYLLLALVLVTGGVVLLKRFLHRKQAVDMIAVAVATAEGFYVDGSRPARNHNPGDLTVDITGTGIAKDGPLIVYGSDNDGWDSLKAQVTLWLTNKSARILPSMTIAQAAVVYTGADHADSWAATFAQVLGVGTDTKIGDLSA